VQLELVVLDQNNDLIKSEYLGYNLVSFADSMRVYCIFEKLSAVHSDMNQDINCLNWIKRIKNAFLLKGKNIVIIFVALTINFLLLPISLKFKIIQFQINNLISFQINFILFI